MVEGSGSGALHAVGDGIARVLAAPVVLAGTIAIVLLYGPTVSDPRHGLGALLISAFLSGGILDRYARRRPTRARGFFAACGAHLGAMLRIWVGVLVLLLAFHAVVGRGFENDYVHEAGFVFAIFLGTAVLFAQVRVAVEDRRSALGALLAGTRFAVRNPAALGIVVAFVAIEILTSLAFERIAPGLDPAGWPIFLLTESWIAAEILFVLASFASATSLFQARLAHAGYTAAPPLTWPDSPAADAIANASPGGPTRC